MRVVGVFYFITVLSFLVGTPGLAEGGPPLVTDNPGTPGNGNWEINFAAQSALSDQSSNIQFPLFDINYGVGEHIQLNLNTGLINVRERGAGTTSGLSLASLATKWRFIDEERFGLAISMYPRFDFHHPFSSDNPIVNAPGSRVFLPLEFSKAFGPFGINPEIGFAHYTGVSPSSEWDYGLAMNYEFQKGKEALFEIHGRSPGGFATIELLYNLGLRYLLTEWVSFIGSFGQTFVAYAGSDTSWNFYGGFQFHF